MRHQVVLVTGAASGNGFAIATRFLTLGMCVVAVDTDVGQLKVCESGPWARFRARLLCQCGDVTREDDIAAIVGNSLARFERLDVLVNNAGITGGAEASILHATPVSVFDQVISVNVRGVFLGCQAVLPVMLKQGGGVIINIASVASLVAFPARAAYTASKGAVLQLTRAIAVDYAASGIRCNALCPGMIETPMTQWRLDQPELRNEVEARIPQRAVGTTADVAGAVAFLAGPDAQYFNGAALVMDGGYTAI